MQTRSRSRRSSGASIPIVAPAADNSVAISASSSRRAWTEAEETKMIEFLITQNLAEAGEEAEFKKSIWTATGKHMSPHWNWLQCRRKWGRLKKEYKIVTQLKSLSEFVYSDQGGVNITVANQDAWDVYIMMRQKNPNTATYKNKSFAHYSSMSELMPQHTLGPHVFRPSTGVRGAAALTSGRPTSPEASGMLPPSTEGGNDSDGLGAPLPPATPGGAHQTPSISSSAHTSKRKFSALSSVSSHSSSQNTSVSSKKPRSSSFIALQTANANMSVRSDTFRDLVNTRKRKTDNKSLERRVHVARLMQDQENYLSSDAMVALLDLIQDNTHFADTYLSLTTLPMRVTWALKRLEEFHFGKEAVLEPGAEETLPEDVREAIADYTARHTHPD